MRLPRTVLGLLAGAALGLAGAIMQGLVRNPLADPDRLGVNAGASLAMVCGIGMFGVTFLHRLRVVRVHRRSGRGPLVYRIGWAGGATPAKLALAGAAISAALGSVTTAVLLADTQVFDEFRFWPGRLAREPGARGRRAGADLHLTRPVVARRVRCRLGVVTAVLGAPVLVLLVRQRKTAEL